MFVKVALAQLNLRVGDLVGNVEKIVATCEQAVDQGADIVVTPELSLVGYPPEDLLLRPAFYARCIQAFQELRIKLARFEHLHVLVGHPVQDVDEANNLGDDGSPQQCCYNAVSVLRGGDVLGTYRKHRLPNYGVFDEARYFTPHSQALTFTVRGLVFGINLCEDIWSSQAPAAAKEAGADILLVPNASPYHLHKQNQRHETVRERTLETGMPVVYTNLVGGQDELVFDGASFVMDGFGRLQAQLETCVESLAWVEFEAVGTGLDRHIFTHRAQIAPEIPLESQVYRALVLGVRDYVHKNGFGGVLIGLSGGIDSALTLAIAVDALGAEKVRTVMMPSPYTADISWIDARDMAQRLGVRYDEIPIAPIVDALSKQLAPPFAGVDVDTTSDTTEENLQARVRGTLLMALSNKTGAIVLTTGNKSEMATGYCTLYGDMAGGFAVIKDVFKTLVYRLSRWRNEQSEVIPERILTRPPSAELRPNQTDQDSLPPYDVLDEILRLYLEEQMTVVDIVRHGYDNDTVHRVVRLVQVNEYKRRQAPIGIRVTERAFGRDWRYPITNHFRE